MAAILVAGPLNPARSLEELEEVFRGDGTWICRLFPGPNREKDTSDSVPGGLRVSKKIK